MKNVLGFATFSAFVCVVLFPVVSFAGTLENVREKGYVQCGVSQGVPGFSNPDENGSWTGIDVDMCRAIAAAALGDADATRYTPTSGTERFTALQSGEIDVLTRNSTWTLVRDSSLGFNFAGVNYYDGQGFIVRKDMGVESIYDLDGAVFCTSAGTTTELNISSFFRANDMKMQLITFERADEGVRAYDAGRCDVYTTDQSGLAAHRTSLSDPDAHVVLPDVISKEPLGPVVRQGDDVWFDVVKWSLFAMIEAEEAGVDSTNVEELRANSKDPRVLRLLGVEGDMGSNLGLDRDWAYDIVSQVGNYGESFARHLGSGTPLGLERGLNDLWTRGGLIYAMPIR